MSAASMDFCSGDVLPPPPPGWVFRPEEELLIDYFLSHKIAGEIIPTVHPIVERDLYGSEAPWDLFAALGTPTQDLYLFTLLKNKFEKKKKSTSSSSSIKIERGVSGKGNWKIQNNRDVFKNDVVIGFDKAFKFMAYTTANRPKRESWVMHEYTLINHQEQCWAICKISPPTKKLSSSSSSCYYYFSSDYPLLAEEPGWKFQPEDDILIDYFLSYKVAGIPIPSEHLIVDRDLYGSEAPWDLFSATTNNPNSDKLYFFTLVKNKFDKKKSNSSIGVKIERRVSGKGTWKVQNKHKVFRNNNKNDVVVGFNKAFNFVPDESANRRKDESWVMHEYTLLKNQDDQVYWALCKVSPPAKKPSHYYSSSSSSSSTEDDYSPPPPPPSLPLPLPLPLPVPVPAKRSSYDEIDMLIDASKLVELFNK